MIVAAESTRNMIGAVPAASAAPIAAIEQTGREALARLREILGLLRAEHYPERLSPLLGADTSTTSSPATANRADRPSST